MRTRLAFIRIPGGSFEQGDFLAKDGRDPVDDGEHHACVRHWVELSDFYLQETEVTNLQIEAFLKEHPGYLTDDSIGDWKRYLGLLTEKFQKDAKAADSKPGKF